MKTLIKSALLLLLFMTLTGCGNDEKTYDAGYSDGQAEGYNTHCEIRGTLIYGHWDSEEYTRGYHQGNKRGVENCIQDRKNGNF